MRQIHLETKRLPASVDGFPRTKAVELAAMGPWHITQCESETLYSVARGLFLEYARTLDFDLCFQGFKEELSTLPGAYSPPDGRLLVAMIGDAYVGCVALRPLTATEGQVCEMKRLYVRPAFRGTGLGRSLAERIVAEARMIGYQQMVLDTLVTMDPAIGLYRSLGFKETLPYYNNPIPEARYFSLLL
jgi:putative acetyltransferase